MKNDNNSLQKVMPFKALMFTFIWLMGLMTIGISILARVSILKDSIWEVSLLLAMAVFLLFIVALGIKAIGKKFRPLVSTPSCNEPYSKTFKFFFFRNVFLKLLIFIKKYIFIYQLKGPMPLKSLFKF